MRILLLLQLFDPEPTVRGLQFAERLQLLGHDVEVLTTFPNYPGGRLYPGYSQRWRRVEVTRGIRVTRVPLYPSHDRSAARRIATYASFALTSCLAGTLSLRRPDVIFVNGPPPTLGGAAALMGAFRRVPFVFDIQDLWPDTLPATGMLRSPRALAVVDAATAWIYRRAAHITVLSPGVRERLVARGTPPDKVTVIYNWAVEAAGKAPAPEPVPDRAGFEVLFAGTMGTAQALDAVLEAAVLLGRERPGVRLTFMGGGVEVERLRQLAIELGLGNVRFLPRVPMEEAASFLARADALLVHLKRDPLFQITIPSKTQAYLAAGKPIVMAVGGDADRLVQAAGAGVCAEPENPRAIADAILELANADQGSLRELGERGRRYYDEHLSVDVAVRKLAGVLEAAAAGRAARS